MRISVAIAITLLSLSFTAIGDDLAMRDAVAKHIGAAMALETQNQAFYDLEALGTAGVPYLIGHLSDVRPLPRGSHISLENKAINAFEGMRHYSPKTVHDALHAILNQLTGQRFEDVYGGASNEVRENNTAKWRSWCVIKFPAKTEVCNGAI
jgi:hypothetical protein